MKATDVINQMRQVVVYTWRSASGNLCHCTNTDNTMAVCTGLTREASVAEFKQYSMDKFGSSVIVEHDKTKDIPSRN